MLSARSRLLYFFSSFSSEKTPAVLRMTKLLQEKIDGVTKVDVEDVSGGCGSMYSVYVESSAFKGLLKVAQHKMITGVLKDEIRDMHGLSIQTKTPEN